jgi:hypothetical protein
MTDVLKSAAHHVAPTEGNRIRDLNDRLRRTLTGGRLVMTQGIAALGEETVERVVRTIRSFDDFDADNDPYAEHDFGAFEIDGGKIFFKIDYFDKALTFGSADPADPTVTERVLTIMLASEY